MSERVRVCPSGEFGRLGLFYTPIIYIRQPYSTPRVEGGRFLGVDRLLQGS